MSTNEKRTIDNATHEEWEQENRRLASAQSQSKDERIAELEIGKPYEGSLRIDLSPPKSACSKNPYRSKEQADDAIRQAMQRRRNRPRYLRSYRCQACRQWHLTRERPRWQE